MNLKWLEEPTLLITKIRLNLSQDGNKGVNKKNEETER